jgi:hypothetical protein
MAVNEATYQGMKGWYDDSAGEFHPASDWKPASHKGVEGIYNPKTSDFLPIPLQTPSMLKGIKNIPRSAIQTGKDIYQSAKNLPQTIEKLGNTVNSFTDPKTLSNAVHSIPSVIKSMEQEAKQSLSHPIDTIKQGVDTIKQGENALGRYVEKNPVQSYLMVGAPGLGKIPGVLEDTAKALTTGGEKIATKAIEKVAPHLLTNKAKQAMFDRAKEATVKAGIKNGIKPPPSSYGKTAKLTEDYFKKANIGVQKIIEHAPKLPETAEEADQMLPGVLQSLHSKYHTMAVSAGQKGAVLDLTPLADAAEKLIGNPEKGISPDWHFMQKADIGTIRRIQSDIQAWRAKPIASLEEGEDLLSHWNEQTKAYYRNPTFNDVSTATYTVGKAREFRNMIDKAVETHEGSGWQQFRNEYGAVRHIQDDIHRRAIAQMGVNPGFFDKLTNLSAVGTFLAGAALHSPQTLIASLGIKGLSAAEKMYRNPDRHIKNMFRDVARYMEQEKKLSMGNTGILKADLPSGALGDTFQQGELNPATGELDKPLTEGNLRSTTVKPVEKPVKKPPKEPIDKTVYLRQMWDAEQGKMVDIPEEKPKKRKSWKRPKKEEDTE